jgi:hypothetical protein
MLVIASMLLFIQKFVGLGNVSSGGPGFDVGTSTELESWGNWIELPTQNVLSTGRPNRRAVRKLNGPNRVEQP